MPPELLIEEEKVVFSPNLRDDDPPEIVNTGIVSVTSDSEESIFMEDGLDVVAVILSLQATVFEVYLLGVRDKVFPDDITHISLLPDLLEKVTFSVPLGLMLHFEDVSLYENETSVDFELLTVSLEKVNFGVTVFFDESRSKDDDKNFSFEAKLT